MMIMYPHADKHLKSKLVGVFEEMAEEGKRQNIREVQAKPLYGYINAQDVMALEKLKNLILPNYDKLEE